MIIQSSPLSNGFVNTVTLQECNALCCNSTERCSTSISQFDVDLCVTFSFFLFFELTFESSRIANIIGLKDSDIRDASMLFAI